MRIKKFTSLIIMAALMVITLGLYSQGIAHTAVKASMPLVPIDGAVFILLSIVVVYGAKRMYETE